VRKLKLRAGGLELEYECEPEELPTIISGVLKAVGPELLQNGGRTSDDAQDPPQVVEVYIREWPGLFVGTYRYSENPLRVRLER